MAKNSRFKTQGQRKCTSKGEEDLYRILDGLFPTALKHTEYPYSRFTNTDNNKLMCDIYINSFSIAFEFQGEMHYKPVSWGKTEKDIFEAQRAYEERQTLDKLKRQICAEVDIPLVEIPYFEWKELKNDAEKKDYVLEEIEVAKK